MLYLFHEVLGGLNESTHGKCLEQCHKEVKFNLEPEWWKGVSSLKMQEDRVSNWSHLNRKGPEAVTSLACLKDARNAAHGDDSKWGKEWDEARELGSLRSFELSEDR